MKLKTVILIGLLVLWQTQTAPGQWTNLVINEFMADNKNTLKDVDGDSSDWIEIFNRSSSTVILTNWYLTDLEVAPNQWAFPATNIGAGKYLVVFASSKDRAAAGKQLHTNFKLTSSGEYLGLFHGTNVVCAYSPQFPEQFEDVSYGIGAGDAFTYFSPATPGATNTGGIVGIVADTALTPASGLYTNQIQVTATNTTTGASIYFTTNCNIPTVLDTPYAAPVTVKESVVIRTMAATSGLKSSAVSAYTYIYLPSVLSQKSNPPGFPTVWTNRGGTMTTADYEMDQRVVTNSEYMVIMTNALRSLPSVLLVTARSNLFNNLTGVYVNPLEEGVAWERPVTLEWLSTNNTALFKVDCGLRIQGGYFRNMTVTRKKSLRVLFKSIYGPSKLRYDLFSNPSTVDAVDEFDTIDFRAGANEAWDVWAGGTGPAHRQYICDEFTRRSHIAMGDPSPHGGFVHLYLDGLYWGIYNFLEKPAESFGSYYFGGDKTNWDAIVRGVAIEGNITAWNTLVSMCSAGVSSNQAYQRLQGCNPDRTRNPAYPDYLDVPNYIDYLIIRQWIGDMDWPDNNWHALRNRDNAASTGFKFAVWDAESGLDIWGTLPTDITLDYRGVAQPYGNLVSNTEFRLLFADRIYRSMFNGGMLTTNQTIPRYKELARNLDSAIVAESARWGDQSGTLYTRASWRTETNYMVGSYFPQRPAVVLQQYKNRGLYPAIDPPVFNQRGGVITNGFTMVLSSTNPVYYTLDGSDPRVYGTGSATGTLYTAPVSLLYTTYVKTRAMVNTGLWSAVDEVLFVKEGSPQALRVTEVMYNPRMPAGGETGHGWTNDDFEYIEVKNEGSETIGLAGTRFTDGITFDFTGGGVQRLAPGEYAVVVRNAAAFTNRYAAWSGIKIAGEFQTTYDFPVNGLSDGGEQITLKDATNATLASFTYSDGRGWPLAADGAGHSLVPLVTAVQTNGVLDYGGWWRASAYIDGSPGRADPTPVSDAVLNEVMAATRYSGGFSWQTSDDWIELYNTTERAFSLTNWYLSDDAINLKKWAIPGSNVISATNWMTFFEVDGFHPATNSGFGINENGEQVYLSYLPGTTNDRVADCIAFKAQESDHACGRYPDGNSYWYTTVPTTNFANRLDTQEVAISEVMYHPAPTLANPEDNTNDEYIELHNTTDIAITLNNEAGAYRLYGGIAYTFATNVTIPAKGYLLIVSFDPVTNTAARTAFTDAYLTYEGIQMVGPYEGKLSNKGDRIALERPLVSEESDDPGLFWVIVDEVIYFDQSPWTTATDGSGKSLRRIDLEVSGNDPANWLESIPSPGYMPNKIDLIWPKNATTLFIPPQHALSTVIDYDQITGAVDYVEFFEGNISLSQDTTAPYEYPWEPATGGTYRLSARISNNGSTNSSGIVTVEAVKLDTVMGVTNCTDSSADMLMILGGNRTADVYACFGKTDGGTNMLAWDTVQRAGMINPGPATIHISGQTPGEYCYRLYGEADGASGWSADTGRFTLSFAGWSQKMLIQFPWYTNSAVLTNFTALVVLNTNRTGFGYGQFASTNGWDLRFMNHGETEALNYDIERWDTNGSSQVWVELPELTAGTKIWAWWGRVCATDTPPWMAQGAAWGTNYDLVLHLATGTSSNIVDSGPSDCDGLIVEPFWYGTGKIGLGWTNSAANRHGRIALSEADTVSLGEEWTVSMWFRAVQGSSTRRVLVAGSNDVEQIAVKAGGNTIVLVSGTNIYDSGVNVNPGGSTWKHVTAVGTGTVTKIYVDGTYAGLSQYMMTNNVRFIGNASQSNQFAAYLDECRIERVMRDASWIKTRWINETSNSLFVSFSEAMPKGSYDRDNDGMADWWEVEEFGGTNVVNGGPADDMDSDQNPNKTEYVAGTDPTNAASQFRLNIVNSNGVVVEFMALSTGASDWYSGRYRLYDLEESTNMAGGIWDPVVGLTNLPGNDTLVIFTNSVDGEFKFYRVKTTLMP